MPVSERCLTFLFLFIRRSFTFHLIDDHGLSEAESHEKFEECSKLRRQKTLDRIREKEEAAATRMTVKKAKPKKATRSD